MNEELFNEATKSNVLTKKLIDQLLESMTYSSISFINWTIETLSLIKARLQRGDRITKSAGKFTPCILSSSLWRRISLLT